MPAKRALGVDDGPRVVGRQHRIVGGQTGEERVDGHVGGERGDVTLHDVLHAHPGQRVDDVFPHHVIATAGDLLGEDADAA